MTAPSTPPPDDAKALREECEQLAGVLWPDHSHMLRCYEDRGEWRAWFRTTGDIDEEGRGPTARDALTALRTAMETACDEALDRLAKVRGKVVSDGR